jgi:hypothetical protein
MSDGEKRSRSYASRRKRILKFIEWQLIFRRWIAFVDLADWCAQSTTAASVANLTSPIRPCVLRFSQSK